MNQNPPPAQTMPVDPLSNTPAQSPTVYASHNVTSVFETPSQPAQNTVAPPTQTPADTPLSAADGDVIEKAWVQKAQTVMEKNKYDPYTLQVEAQLLSQNYLKQRFGLDVSLPQESQK